MELKTYDLNPQFSINGLKFRFYSAAEIIALSVKEITNVETFDNLGHANVGGLYDPALGSSEKFDSCSTCGLVSQNCPGHMGHIKLAIPLFNTVIFPTLYHLLKAVCFKCNRLCVEQDSESYF
ncbi:DNA-directed RNA polymerase II subunit RPB1-like [Ruditapes philippinarum]|uniref:DNA-directed RNA polymerase II subunit RPB1-like n=1 Tax=Ruditapes philippinarum TaxID=129788 RepID=UPI00295B703B|nr:DNA-directed RNA polymerase II subunit RPB1-like [Ruditapes philippinarum]